ncbi:C6 zinc finger domain protein [Colletotrichum sojae]|uniref:C6 zinc finger domain protein n=1 Tax=Colletotrichum sojae TaxID=2175907 RepID=A0A8H6IYM8_9PEZI|nr:C6 zinc finger domain protein [Colletotrichum sojae]
MPRAGTQKVKTGCITCKIRRIKCDEGRPSCRRCLTTGRKCDGYTVPPKGTYSWSHLLRVTTPQADAKLATQHQPVAWTGATAAENRAMSFFHRVAAPALAGSLNKYFWTNVVVQVANQEPVARHAVLAVSSLYEAFLKRFRSHEVGEDGTEAPRDAFAVWHYNEAIRLLRSTRDRALTLFVCVLFICIELLRKNAGVAIEHCRHGINILNEVRCESEFIKNHVKPAIANLTIVPYLRGAGPESFPTLGGPPPPAMKRQFKGISEAHAQLIPVLVRLMRFMRSGGEARLEPGRKGPEPDTEWTRQSVVADLDSWYEAFQQFKTYLYVPANAEERNVSRLLEMRWIVGKMMCTMHRSGRETDFDEHEADFRRMVALATPVAAAAKEPPTPEEPLYAGEFALELGFTSLLAYVAMKCRVFEMRMAAWRLMIGLARPEINIWSEDLTLCLCKVLIETEHGVELREGDTPVEEVEGDLGLPPEERRVASWSLETKITREGKRTFLFNLMQRKADSDEYVVTKKWMRM